VELGTFSIYECYIASTLICVISLILELVRQALELELDESMASLCYYVIADDTPKVQAGNCCASRGSVQSFSKLHISPIAKAKRKLARRMVRRQAKAPFHVPRQLYLSVNFSMCRVLS